MPTPAEIVADKRPGGTVVGWRLDPERRKELLAAVPPRYRRTVADHVTLVARAASNTPLPGRVTAKAVGRADDAEGVEALVVQIDNDIDRPGGGVYHITWSLGTGREAVESNQVIAEKGWRAFDKPLRVVLIPARF